MNYTYLLVPGHGETVPNFDKNKKSTWYKSYYHPSVDLTIIEGDINRKIKNILLNKLKDLKIKAIDVVPESADISLPARLARIQNICKTNKNCIHIEIHSNAHENETAHGFEIFSTRGKNNSDIVKEAIYRGFLEEFDNFKNFSRDRGKKETDYWLIKRVPCMAILLENFFFSNLKEAQFLASKEGQEKIANAVIRGIEMIEKNGINNLKTLYKM